MCDMQGKMKLAVLFTLVMVSLRVVCAQGSDGSGDSGAGERPRVLCGRVLADARMLYCYSSTSAEEQKRSTDSPLIVALHPRSFSVVWPWLGPRPYQQQRALALAMRGKRDPGLVDECCLKPCYLSELLAYC